MLASIRFSWRRAFSLIAVLLLGACSSQEGCRSVFSFGKDKPLAVTVEKAGRRDLVELVVATGKVQGRPVQMHALFVAQGRRACQAVAVGERLPADEASVFLESMRLIVAGA